MEQVILSPKIKWVKNSRVKRNSKIQPCEIVEKESDAQSTDIIVTMKDSSKKYPIINIEFPSETEISERKEKTRNGSWITKSWRTKHNVIASINTEENYIDFNRTRFKPSELRGVMKAVDSVIEII